MQSISKKKKGVFKEYPLFIQIHILRTRTAAIKALFPLNVSRDLHKALQVYSAANLRSIPS